MVTLVSWQCDAMVTGAKIGWGRISGTIESWKKKIAWRHISYNL